MQYCKYNPPLFGILTSASKPITNLNWMAIHGDTSSTIRTVIPGHRCCTSSCWRWWGWGWGWFSPPQHPHDGLLHPMLLLGHRLQSGLIQRVPTVVAAATGTAEFSPIKGHFDSILIMQHGETLFCRNSTGPGLFNRRRYFILFRTNTNHHSTCVFKQFHRLLLCCWWYFS